MVVRPTGLFNVGRFHILLKLAIIYFVENYELKNMQFSRA